jgi:hypothetical protein
LTGCFPIVIKQCTEDDGEKSLSSLGTSMFLKRLPTLTDLYTQTGLPKSHRYQSAFFHFPVLSKDLGDVKEWSKSKLLVRYVLY